MVIYTVVQSCSQLATFRVTDWGNRQDMPMDTFTPTAALRQQMDELEDALARLARQLGQLELLEAHVYPLPAVPQGEEHDPIEATDVAISRGRRRWPPP